jgi:peptidoglycan hydrolase-like protein with peptidoglycan-binding domain
LSDSIAARLRRLITITAFVAVAVITAPAFAAVQQFGSRMLTLGMRGSDVRTLQHDLTVAGFATKVSGVFNKTTRAHVIGFQRRYHLQADGVVGPATSHEIDSVVAAKLRSDIKSSGASGVSASDSSGAPSGNSGQPSGSSGQPTGSSGTGSAGTTGPTGPTGNSGTTGTTGPTTGGTGFGPGPNNAPPEDATLNADGLAVAPADAPEAIREAIEAANAIAFKPYIYGGGHQSFRSKGYDCSGSVSYALHGAGLLSSPLDSSQFMSWGKKGDGRWITIYANGGHAYMEIAGLWFDTADQEYGTGGNSDDRWSVSRVSPGRGFTARHPVGW